MQWNARTKIRIYHSFLFISRHSIHCRRYISYQMHPRMRIDKLQFVLLRQYWNHYQCYYGIQLTVFSMSKKGVSSFIPHSCSLYDHWRYPVEVAFQKCIALKVAANFTGTRNEHMCIYNGSLHILKKPQINLILDTISLWPRCEDLYVTETQILLDTTGTVNIYSFFTLNTNTDDFRSITFGLKFSFAIVNQNKYHKQL